MSAILTDESTVIWKDTNLSVRLSHHLNHVNINIGICTFVYTNYIANIVNVLCSIALGVCLWQRTSQSLHITDALKQTILYTELGYVTVCDTNEDNEELYRNIENIYGISKEDFLKLYHK